jgi:hypothetical protein
MSRYRGINTDSMELRVLYLAPLGLTLKDLRRRARGQGSDYLGLIFGKQVLRVSAAFGAAIERLAFSGVIRIDRDRRGKIRVSPGRNFVSLK